jgi:hypothetical protein
MTLIFEQYRSAGTSEILVTTSRTGNTLPSIEVGRHDESKEINSIKVEIIDNKPLYIPLGRTDQVYKIQFKTFKLIDFNVWYTVIGNDVLKVINSSYAEFPIGSYWNVENISSTEDPGSPSAFMSNDVIGGITRGNQPIIMEYELQLSESFVDLLGRPRT